MSVADMRQKLLQWNPKWNPATVMGWSDRQVQAVYQKEKLKVVAEIVAMYN